PRTITCSDLACARAPKNRPLRKVQARRINGSCRSVPWSRVNHLLAPAFTWTFWWIPSATYWTPRTPRIASASSDVSVAADPSPASLSRSEEHTSELQSRENLVCRLLL